MILPALLLSTLLGPSAQEPPAAPAAAPAASSASVDSHIAAGLVAFKKKRFRQAEIEFRQAVDADPNNAAATWYLGYTYYKIAEPKRPFDPGKQKAAELFAKAYQLDPQFKPVWSPSAPGGGGARRSHRARPAAEPKPGQPAATPATPPAKQG
jgi:tetratricopeptide (TPR) repeat protein